MRYHVGWTTSIVAALILAGLACGPAPQAPAPAAQAQAQPQGQPPAEAEKSSPFPPPPIEIEPGGGGNLVWKVGVDTLTAAMGDTDNRVSDEFTWKVSQYEVTDKSGKIHEDVNYVTITSDGKDLAVIRRVGGQLHWTVLGDTPEICSKYDVSGWVKACANGGKTAGNRGIPAVLLDLAKATITAQWTGSDGKPVQEEVDHVFIKPRTCPPY